MDRPPTTVASRDKLACNVGARIGRKSNSRCRCSARPHQQTLRNSPGGSVARDSTDGGRPLAGFRVARYHGADQRVLHPGAEARFGGAVIMQVFVQRRRDSMLNAGFHSVGRKSRANALSKAGSAPAPFPRVSPNLCHARARRYAANRPFAKSFMLPVFSIGMVSFRLRGNRWT
jgi:hypothetical protein